MYFSGYFFTTLGAMSIIQVRRKRMMPFILVKRNLVYNGDDDRAVRNWGNTVSGCTVSGNTVPRNTVSEEEEKRF